MPDDDRAPTPDAPPDAHRRRSPGIVIGGTVVGTLFTRAFFFGACSAGLLPIQDANPSTGEVLAYLAGAAASWALTVAVAWRWGGRAAALAAGLVAAAFAVVPVWSELQRIPGQVDELWRLR